MTQRLMQSLAEYIERHADEPLPLARLAARAHLSPTHLQRRFKAVMGLSPKAYQDAARLKRLKHELKAGKRVLDSIQEAGFQSTSRVYGEAARGLGMTLSSYRAGAAGETITHACRETSLGPLLMAATDRGVCFAEFGTTESALLGRLRAEFPHAVLIASKGAHSRQLDDWILALERHMARGAPRPELPLDLRGTAFQIRVWRFLVGIPAGQVTSYAQVAKAVGSPRAARAAASACAANRIAVLIPCHRVLRGDGELGGYRWGALRKRRLLEYERGGNAA